METENEHPLSREIRRTFRRRIYKTADDHLRMVTRYKALRNSHVVVNVYHDRSMTILNSERRKIGLPGVKLDSKFWFYIDPADSGDT